MCFYNDDYDWVATVNEVIDKPAERQTKCYECGAGIQVGDIARFVHQQESQECQCEWCQFGRFDPDWGGGGGGAISGVDGREGGDASTVIERSPRLVRASRAAPASNASTVPRTSLPSSSMAL
jgi:hypothetical protein